MKLDQPSVIHFDFSELVSVEIDFNRRFILFRKPSAPHPVAGAYIQHGHRSADPCVLDDKDGVVRMWLPD